jgi:hypothetical protein
MKTKSETETLDTNPYASPNSEHEEQREESVEYHGKVYNTLSIGVATIFGSVLAGGLLLHSNYDHFEQKTKALFVILMTTILTLAFMLGMLIIDFPVVFLFIGINFIIAVVLLPLTQVLQGKELEKHEDNEREFHSFIRAALVGVSCSLAMGIMLFFAYTMFLMVH